MLISAEAFIKMIQYMNTLFGQSQGLIFKNIISITKLWAKDL